MTTQKLTETKMRVLEAVEDFEIIDAHEHLPPEQERTESKVDVFTLFSHYTRGDLLVAGMSESDYCSLFDRTIPLDQRWSIFSPYWERIRWGSYARAALLGVKRFYGFEDINDDTYEMLSEAIQEQNKPGIYQRVLRNACKIRTALNQYFYFEDGVQYWPVRADTPLLTPLVPLIYEMETWERLAHPLFDPEAKVRSLDDYLDALRAYVVRIKKKGVVGLKMISYPCGIPNREDALTLFNRLREGTESELSIPTNPLKDYVIDQMISFATNQNLVVAVHTGYWVDFREMDPLHMIPILQRHPNTRFDLYHLGFPWIRQTLMLGKGFPNVWLNWCWTHIISQRSAAAALDEAIDLVPMNKISVFGGDYRGMVPGTAPVEKVYGHLVMAKENVAEVLAARITDKRMTEAQALELARKWFWENPKELYHLQF